MIGVAFNSQICMRWSICTCKELQPLIYSYLKFLKVSSESVVQNEQSNPEITFVKSLKKVCLQSVLNTLQKVIDYFLQELQKLFEPFWKIA
jgi:hypothetical protein